MNYSGVLRILRSIILSFFCINNLHAQYKRDVDPLLSNYYQLIGYEQYQKDIQDKIKAARVQAEQKFQTERQEAERRLAKAEETQKLAVRDLPQSVIAKNKKEYEAANTAYQAILNQQEDFARTIAYQDKEISAKITQACQQARKNYQKEIEKAQKEAEEADELEIVAKNEAVARLQRRLVLTATACPLLLNPTKRQAYDAQLIGVPLAAGFFERIQRSVSNAMLVAPDKKILINDILGDLFSQIEIPGPALKIFNQDLDIRSISLLPKPMGPDVQYGLGFTGLMALNRLEVRLSVYVIQDIYGARKFSFTVDLPTTYKISDLFPTLNGFDAFKFPQMKFIISNFEGIDQDGFPFKKGFNFGAILDLSGPLQLLGELRDKASALKSLVFESKPIILNGVIPVNIARAEFRAEVPLYIGVDLQKISAMPRTISNVINKITSDDFTLAISPVKPKKVVKEEKGEKVTETVKPYFELKKVEREPTVEIVTLPSGEEDFVFKKVPVVKTIAKIPLGYKITAETGIRITLGTQPQPIRINVHGIVIPISKDHPQGMLTVGGSIKNILEFGPFAIGDIIIEFDWDPLLLPVAASFGIPFTGIGIGGKLYLGRPGDARAALEAAGGFRVSSAEIPDIVLQLAGDNIQFGTLIRYATEKAAQAKLLKAPIPADRIPTMTLHNIWGYCAVKDTTIAGRLYKGGMGLQVETEFFEYKAGLRIFVDNQFKVSGWGYMPPVNFKVKGAEVFRLYGLTPDKGPRMSFNFDPKDPLKGIFGLQGTIHLPMFGLRQKTDFMWRGYLLDADFESEFPGFSVLFGIRMNLKEGVEMLSPYDELKRNVEQLLATADMQSADAQKAKKLFDEAIQFESQKKHQEAMSRLEQAQLVLSKAGVVAVPQAESTEVSVLEDRMRMLKTDVDTLVQKAAQKQNDPRYKAAEGLIRQATIGYKQYYGLVSQKAANDAKVKQLTSIIENLNKAKTWLYKVLEEEFTTKKEVETEPGAKWSRLYVKFGFKGDFAKFLNEHAVTTLRKIKENAIKKLDQLTERIAGLQAQAVGGVETEINRVKEIITAKEKEISGLQAECRSLPLYRQPKCRASIAAQQTVLASRKAYLNALLKPGKAVVRGVVGAAAAVGKQLAQSKALRAATEAILEGAASGLEMIATGINFFNITEARGEYSWEDMKALRLPRLVQLVATIEIPGMPMRIVLNDLQFDFKHPAQSAAEITYSIMSAFIETQQNKYLKYVERFMSEE